VEDGKAATPVIHAQQSELTLSTSNYRSRYYWECPTCSTTCHSQGGQHTAGTQQILALDLD